MLHPAFGEALKLGKKEADERVERSLYSRAVGYHYDAVKIFLPYGATEPVYAPYVEHCGLRSDISRGPKSADCGKEIASLPSSTVAPHSRIHSSSLSGLSEITSDR
jgi:hypothetical protein